MNIMNWTSFLRMRCTLQDYAARRIRRFGGTYPAHTKDLILNSTAGKALSGEDRNALLQELEELTRTYKRLNGATNSTRDRGDWISLGSYDDSKRMRKSHREILEQDEASPFGFTIAGQGLLGAGE